MRRRRRGGRAIGPRLSRVTKAGGGPGAPPVGFGSGKCTHPPQLPGEGEEGQRSFACISSGITTVIRVTCGAIKGTITDLMSHSQFHCTVRVHLDLHGLIFETSICYWQDQPGSAERQKQKRSCREEKAHGGPPTPRPPGRGGAGGLARAGLFSFNACSVRVLRLRAVFTRARFGDRGKSCDFRGRVRAPVAEPLPNGRGARAGSRVPARWISRAVCGALRAVYDSLRPWPGKRRGSGRAKGNARDAPTIRTEKANPRGGEEQPCPWRPTWRPGRRLPQAGLVFRSAKLDGEREKGRRCDRVQMVLGTRESLLSPEILTVPLWLPTAPAATSGARGRGRSGRGEGPEAGRPARLVRPWTPRATSEPYHPACTPPPTDRPGRELQSAEEREKRPRTGLSGRPPRPPGRPGARSGSAAPSDILDFVVSCFESEEPSATPRAGPTDLPGIERSPTGTRRTPRASSELRWMASAIPSRLHPSAYRPSRPRAPERGGEGETAEDRALWPATEAPGPPRGSFWLCRPVRYFGPHLSLYPDGTPLATKRPKKKKSTEPHQIWQDRRGGRDESKDTRLVPLGLRGPEILQARRGGRDESNEPWPIPLGPRDPSGYRPFLTSALWSSPPDSERDSSRTAWPRRAELGRLPRERPPDRTRPRPSLWDRGTRRSGPRGAADSEERGTRTARQTRAKLEPELPPPGRKGGPPARPCPDKRLDRGMTFNGSQRWSCSATHDTPTQNQVVYESFSTGFDTNLRCAIGEGAALVRPHPSPFANGSARRGPPRGLPGYARPTEDPRRCGIVTFRRDSDLEAFSHNPTDGSFAPVAPQPSTRTKCLNLRFLSY
ncbi:hypothetical protein KOW79_011922 [Hemibagrus wyckioides]|uniref:Uncharacterized protein n=2 Tax=Hemibagrus wyckioides TaxID=337641 RepID=A0A9D3NI16_9TELE|nr:hypothetical protein KOW79_011922 [Hemibagrus wyckioides]